MNLIFQGGDEIFKFFIDRVNKKLQVASSLTGYKMVDRPWKDLFDPGKEKQQEDITDKLNDKDFKASVVISMGQNGYQIKR